MKQGEALLITYVVVDKIPESGYRQVSFLTSTNFMIQNKIHFLGINGSYELTESQLQIEVSEGKLLKIKPLKIDENIRAWLGVDGQYVITNNYDFTNVIILKPTNQQ